MDTFIYTPEGLTSTSKLFSGKQTTIPLNVLDFFVDNYVSAYAMKNFVAYRKATKLDENGNIVAAPEITTPDKLVGVDLTGKRVHVYYANWEDSEWLVSGDATSVEQVDGDKMSYRFVFPMQDEWDNDTDDSFYNKYPDLDYGTERLFNYYLSEGEEIWVSVK